MATGGRCASQPLPPTPSPSQFVVPPHWLERRSQPDHERSYQKLTRLEAPLQPAGRRDPAQAEIERTDRGEMERGWGGVVHNRTVPLGKTHSMCSFSIPRAVPIRRRATGNTWPAGPVRDTALSRGVGRGTG